MLITLSQAQLDDVAPICPDGTLAADTDLLAAILAEVFGVESVRVALTRSNCDRREDGSPEPEMRTLRGICWRSIGDDRCHKWSFRTDGCSLSTTDEGVQPCPTSENTELTTRAIIAVANQYPESAVDERTSRMTVRLPSGRQMLVRVVVTQDPRVVRAEDVVSGLERTAFNAGSLGVAMVTPLEDGQATIRTFGME